jgi:hypothetical protein
MNNLIQPLRLHTTEAERLHYRQLFYKYKVLPPLVMPSTSLIPFVFYEYVDFEFLPIIKCSVINYDTAVEQDITANMTFIFGITNYYTYMYYPGTSTISALKPGRYYIYIKTGYNTEFWSDLFLVGSYKTVFFEFKNTKTIVNGPWFRDENYKAYYRGLTMDEGEFDEYAESFQDLNNFPVYSYQRHDKLRTAVLLGDSNVVDCLKMISKCDTVFLTDEVNDSHQVVITDVDADKRGGNYMNVNVKYRIIGNSYISVNADNIRKVAFTQEGTAFKTPEKGIYLGPDKVYLGKKKVIW